jgi:hypothetical protein
VGRARGWRASGIPRIDPTIGWTSGRKRVGRARPVSLHRRGRLRSSARSCAQFFFLSIRCEICAAWISFDPSSMQRGVPGLLHHIRSQLKTRAWSALASIWCVLFARKEKIYMDQTIGSRRRCPGAAPLLAARRRR